MAGFTFHDYEGFGQYAKEHYNFSQAVRVGDRIECSGQGGWKGGSASTLPELAESLEEQIDLAFNNIDMAMKTAGGKGLSQVYRITSYHVRMQTTPETIEYMAKSLAKWFPDYSPIWTAVGVEALGLPTMLVEIEAVAHDPKD
ncbi:hypothetical protein LTR10_006072 [Elasticomyces elasticus]|uniref:Uncharacterized protein n=1 Tax=Elasticomyces elasticus TaxID=574655 RepID=A0AAN7W5X9_9PEZI|nr:hypothetical protein LTR10_006072 [Elasticomyces elasticus]KAK4966873.1 hypothetical protein LTR42_011187 [Elasticomyces elasticus]KAK5698186.1 hypothetical protein LTR97_007147 [Elasticomyces elasticus]